MTRKLVPECDCGNEARYADAPELPPRRCGVCDLTCNAGRGVISQVRRIPVTMRLHESEVMYLDRVIRGKRTQIRNLRNKLKELRDHGGKDPE